MISKEFLENVESGDLMTVRSALLDDLIIDRTFRTFDEDFNVANQRLNILVPYDGEPFETDAGKWDKEYLNQQKVALMVNFSEERIAHLKAVIAKVMPPDEEKENRTVASRQMPSEGRTGRTVKAERVVPREPEKNKVENRPASRTSSEKTNVSPRTGNGSSRTGRRVISETSTDKDSSEKSKSETDGVGTALIIGGAAVAAVGVAIAEPVVIGAGVVAVGAGVCVKVNNRR